MANPALCQLCALGAAQPESHVIAGIAIVEDPSLAMASLAVRVGQDRAVAAAIKNLTGLALPGPGGLAVAGDWAAFWTSPGQWMLTAPHATHEDIAARIKAAVGAAASITDQTDGWVRFDLTGARLPDMLERLCNADVRAMQGGQATRCQIEHLGTFLLCHRSGEAFSALTLRSGARSMMHALETAAKSLS